MAVIAVVTDLIFGTKITGTGKALGKPVLVARTLEKLREHLDALAAATQTPGEYDPCQVIVDLNVSGMDPIEAIRVAKSHRINPHVIAYLSHIQVELAEQARQSGADQVMARSSFVSSLPTILEQG